MNRLKHKETQPKPQEKQTRRNYRIKTQNKLVIPIEKTRNMYVLEFVLEWKWKKEMKRTRKLMWLELLEMCTPLEG